MAKLGSGNSRFEEIDANQDGVIDQNEFHEWASRDEGYPSSYSPTTNQGSISSDKGGHSYHIMPYSAYGTKSIGNDSNGLEIHTGSQNETNEYLAKRTDIYKDPNPQIIRRPATDGSRTYEQRILVRYLQPPEVPPPGPLIIQQQYGPQPAAPPRLVLIERPPSPPTPPPIILRERPPTPPPQIPQETKMVMLPPPPVPPPSVHIKRFPRAPEKPRDIIIERWLPYGPAPARQTIVRPPALATKYPEPRNIIEIYESVQMRTVRRFQKSGPTRESPEEYLHRYGGSLLDSEKLVQEARHLGVYEDLSSPGR